MNHRRSVLRNWRWGVTADTGVKEKVVQDCQLTAAVMYRLGTVALFWKQNAQVEVSDLEMLRFWQGVASY